MLIDFTVKNYCSIKDPITISALATSIKEHPNCIIHLPREKEIKLLNSIVIYGPNASGKSNTINALNDFKTYIIESTDLKIDDEIPCYKPFRLDKKCLTQPTEFEIEFVIKRQIRYKYSIVFDAYEVLKEVLLFYPKGKESTLFVRESGKIMYFGNQFRGPARMIEKQLLKNTLFLSKAANSNNELLSEVYRYFKDRIAFDTPARKFINFTTILCKENNSQIKKKVNDFIKAADIGIEFINIIKTEQVEDEHLKWVSDDIKKILIENKKFRPKMFHKQFDNNQEIGTVAFDLQEESGGTVKLYDLSGELIHCLQNGLTYVADELNNSLHPSLMNFIIQLFQNPKTNPNKAQLIFVTHDTSILKADNFRRDQIWFTEKDEFGATKLYSMSDFDYRKVRSQIPFDHWYLSGRFGALPITGNLDKWFENA